STSRHKKLMFK
nr:Chain E, CELLULAR TUMOR ANTIGEN P53 [Homo sapiens]